LVSSNLEKPHLTKVSISAVLLDPKVDKIQMEINENDHKICLAQRDIAAFEELLEDLIKPFKAINIAEFRHSELNVTNRPSVFAPDLKITKVEHALVEKFTTATSKYVGNWAKGFLIISILLVCNSILICFDRNDFIDNILIAVIYTLIYTDKLSVQEFRYFFMFALATFALDIYWILSFNKAAYVENPSVTVKKIVSLLQLINIGLKGVWILFFWRNTTRFEDFLERTELFLSLKKPLLSNRF